MQFGFVIDHGRCIGCHACTVACKSENDVPVGSFRTWVKQVEVGVFPAVKRSFAVLRCNQCSEAPCVEICPVSALEKRADGIVDIDPMRCIGCKSCLQACPYDALYIHPEKGTAEKCHFCAHRTEQGLAPACAIVCPTEAIIPGDFDDPTSRVARFKATGRLQMRKTEAGTGPNVGYLEAAELALDPGLSTLASGFLWSHVKQGLQHDAELARAHADPALARTTYDIQHKGPWGWKVWTYLFTKSIAAGLVLVLAAMALAGEGAPATRTTVLWLVAGSLAALAATAVLLIADLQRPERFLYILLKPQWRSWLVKGTIALGAFGLSVVALGWQALATAPGTPAAPTSLAAATSAWTLVPAVGLAVLAAIYSAFLFGQAKGRVLWLKRGFALHLFFQALLAGAAVVLLFALLPAAEIDPAAMPFLRAALGIGLLGHLAMLAFEAHGAPPGRRPEYERTIALFHGRGPLAREHLLGSLLLGIAFPLMLLAAPEMPDGVRAAAAVFALVGLFLSERLFVRAGQALPIH